MYWELCLKVFLYVVFEYTVWIQRFTDLIENTEQKKLSSWTLFNQATRGGSRTAATSKMESLCDKSVRLQGVWNGNTGLKWVKIQQNTGFYLIRIFSHKDRIEEFVLIREYMGQRNPAFWHIFCSEVQCMYENRSFLFCCCRKRLFTIAKLFLENMNWNDLYFTLPYLYI